MDRRKFLASAAAAPFVLRRAALARPEALALVTADLESRLVAVRLSTGAVHSTISTLDSPRSIETVGRRAAVAHTDIGVVSIVDGSSLSVVHVLRGFGEPRYTAAHPDGRHAYVTDAARGEVVALDVLRRRVLGRTLGGPRPRHVTLPPAGRTPWGPLR